MAELTRGTVTDRPWGRTLAALAMRGLTGQVTIYADGRQYIIALVEGAVGAAFSPLASDSAVRVALTAGLVSSSQVPEITRKLAIAGNRDELDVVAEAARLAPDQTQRLRRRLVAQRAARTFSIEQGEFIVVDEVTLPVVPGTELDVRTVVYYGARGNLSEERLRVDLPQLGAWFQIKPEAMDDLPQFGFGEAEQPVIQLLLDGSNVSDLDLAQTELDARGVRAIVYALACCGACEASATERSGARAMNPSEAPTELRRGTPSPTAAPTQPRQRIATPPAVTPRVAPAPAPAPAPAAPSRPTPVPEAARAAAAATRPVNPLPQASRAKANPAAMAETQALINEKLPLLDRADHFTLLGVDPSVSVENLRKAYFDLARKLHPDRLASLGVADEKRSAQRLFASINAAFAVLNEPGKRAEYASILQRGGAAAIKAEEAQADELAAAVMRAEEAFKRGELALRRDQVALAVNELTAAVQLQPDEPEYRAALAWAKFLAAPDKTPLAVPTRRELQRAVEANDQNVNVRFYLGRLERILGKEREALAHFHAVLAIKPNHPEASSEARLLEQRLKGKR